MWWRWCIWVSFEQRIRKRNWSLQCYCTQDLQTSSLLSSTQLCTYSSHVFMNPEFSIYLYRGSSPYANFITANFINEIFQNFPDIFHYCYFYDIAKYRKSRSNETFWPKKRISLYLANATFSQNQKSH